VMAPEEGRFLGQCAEFCGLAHADMLLEVVAEPAEQFRAWVAQTKREQAEGANLVQLGQQVSQQTCVQCHSFQQGRNSPNPQSPNLYNYATAGPFAPQLRRLKDSGDQAWLTKWVTNAPAIKPGTGMPRWEGVLQPRQIEAVVAYLMTLK
jgi:cytochrome c oxidase subunit II